MWDLTTPFGQRVERLLVEREVIWLVTSGADGTPHPSPVWFLREGATLLIYSRPEAPKLRHVQAQSRVALHFDTDPHGNEVTILYGTAAHDPAAPPSDQHGAYQAKYRAGIARIGMDPASFAQAYSAPMRVQIERVRGF
ncbi:MAG: hypothetical protein OHK0015_49190 [Chloroflexi bacterium OHK40]